MDYKTVSSVPGGNSFLGDNIWLVQIIKYFMALVPLMGPTEGSLLAAVLPYVIMIVFLPIGSFFFTKSIIFEDLLSYSETTANVYGAIFSVILLHILLALFILKAFQESSVKGSKQD